MTHKTQIVPKGISLFIILGLLSIMCGSIYTLQVKIDSINENSNTPERLLYFPNGRFIKAISLGYDNLLANIFWMKTISYFGKHVVTDRDYKWLYHMLDIVTTLNPHFMHVYYFAGVVLPWEVKNIDGAIYLLNKGITYNPDKEWYIYYLLGFNYMFFKNDFYKASEYFLKAAKFKDAPILLSNITSRLLSEIRDPNTAINLLTIIYNRTEDTNIKEKIIYRIKRLVVERDIIFLEALRDRYYTLFQKYPDTLEDIVRLDWINSLPIEPFGGGYYIRKDNHHILSTTFTERLKIYTPKKKAEPNNEPN